MLGSREEKQTQRPQPLLQNRADRQRAENIVDQIAHSLRQTNLIFSERGVAHDPSLAHGTAGLSLFFAYLAIARGSELDRETAVEYLNCSISAVASIRQPLHFFAGITGIACAVEHLKNVLGEKEGDLAADVDALAVAYIEDLGLGSQFDLVQGIVGFGAYSLERLPYASARKCLALVVDRLAKIAECAGEEVTWFTTANLLGAAQRSLSPNGRYDCGMAHGIAGVICLLSRAYEAGISPEKTRHLVNGAINWLFRQRLTKEGSSVFPAFVHPDQSFQDARLAWCYGDPGIATAVFTAGRCLRVQSWQDEALVLARRAASRRQNGAQIVDACLCHGSSGLAQIFNRFYQCTGEQAYRDAACYWIDWTLFNHQFGSGIGGYSTFSALPSGRRAFIGKPGVLEGSAGIGLALLAALEEDNSNWDRFLLIDCRR